MFDSLHGREIFLFSKMSILAIGPPNLRSVGAGSVFSRSKVAKVARM